MWTRYFFLFVAVLFVSNTSAIMHTVAFQPAESASISGEMAELTDPRILLSFDLSAIPENAVIWYAGLRLYDESGLPWNAEYVPVHVVPLSRSWDPESVSWDGPSSGEDWTQDGGDFDATRTAYRVLMLDAETPAKFILTSTVKEWLAGERQNYGIMAMLQDVADLQDITEYFNASALNPSLEIRYVLPPDSPQ